MEIPNTHSITKGLLKLEPGQWRLFIAVRGVYDRNLRQATAHLSNCNNNESLECKCDEVQ